MAMDMAMAMVTAPVIMNKAHSVSAKELYRLRKFAPMFEKAARGYEAARWLDFTKVD